MATLATALGIAGAGIIALAIAGGMMAAHIGAALAGMGI